MTKLIAENNPVDIRFKDLKPGNIIEQCGNFFLKLENTSVNDDIYNAVYMGDGELVYFSPDESVTIVREAILKY